MDIKVVDLKSKKDALAATNETHGGYARRLIAMYESGNLLPYMGSFWIFNPTTQLYDEVSLDSIASGVPGLNFDGKPRCRTLSDYRSIVQTAFSMLTGDKSLDRMSDAPIGVAAGMNFYRLDGEGGITKEPLRREHRAKFKLSVEPDANCPTPLLDQLIGDAFPTRDDDSEEQRRLLWQHFGAAIFGVAAPAQKAFLWVGKASSGKSTLQKIISGIFPSDRVIACPPHLWGREYNAATLAGKTLNIVGELDDTQALGASFKNVTGGDLLTGRHPTHRPFSFVSIAAHIFNSNFLPPTTDRSQAFFRRWSIIVFRWPVDEAKSDPKLAEKILATELPGLLWRVFEGAKSLSNNICFIETEAQRETIARWRRQTNSVEEFLHDDDACLLIENETTTFTDLFKQYEDWCDDRRRHKFGRNAFRDQMLEVGGRFGVKISPDQDKRRVWTGVYILSPFNLDDGKKEALRKEKKKDVGG